LYVKIIMALDMGIAEIFGDEANKRDIGFYDAVARYVGVFG